MRTLKSVFAGGILLLLGFFIAGVANAAPDMSEWEGKWFTYTVTLKGIEFNGTNFTKGSTKESGYFKIWDWDGENFQIDAYHLDGRDWVSDAQTLQFLAGNDLKFLFLLRNEADGFAFAALVDGKVKNGVLSSATITTYGGLVADGDDNDFEIGSISLSAKMIDASKVKVSPDAIVH
jgi:hypothetical protein